MWLTLYSVSQYSPLDRLAGRSVTVESSNVNVKVRVGTKAWSRGAESVHKADALRV